MLQGSSGLDQGFHQHDVLYRREGPRFFDLERVSGPLKSSPVCHVIPPRDRVGPGSEI